MSIRIDIKKCVGCGRCAEVCPGNLLELRGGTAVMRYPRDCWGCASCVKECPAQAVVFFLGADIGGRGSTLIVAGEGDVLHWQVRRPDGTTQVVDIDRKNANKY